MPVDINQMTMTEKIEAACREVAIKVIERARQTGTPVILWENGQIVRRSWQELIGEPKKTADQPNPGTIAEERIG